MSFYLEHAPDVFKRCGNFHPRDRVLSQVGFRSVYALTKDDAIRVIERGDSRNLTRFHVFSDEILMDFDNGMDDNCKQALQWAKQHKCSWTLWSSGSKGYHLEIAAVPKYGSTIPQSQRAFVDTLGIDVDRSLYRHSSLYRLPGTVHKNTGNKKVLVDQSIGECLVDYEVLADMDCQINFEGLATGASIKEGLEMLVRNFNRPPAAGGRTMRLWSVGKYLKDAGMKPDVVFAMMNHLNESWGDRAKEPTEVARAWKDAVK